MYYKNKNNDLYFEPSQSVIERDGLEEITESEFQELLVIQNTPTPEQELQAKVNEAQKYLISTDWYYARKAETGEEVPALVLEKRIECRKFIQENTEGVSL